MKYLVLAAFLLFSVTTHADDATKESDAARELAESMGINSLLKSTIDQTLASLRSSMSDLSKRLETKYPSMSSEQSAELEQIFSSYITSIMNSIDINKAAIIYTTVITNGMSEKEVELANEYYTSSEGKNTMKVVGEASKKMNEYLLKQISDSQKVALTKFSNELESFNAKMIQKE